MYKIKIKTKLTIGILVLFVSSSVLAQEYTIMTLVPKVDRKNIVF